MGIIQVYPERRRYIATILITSLTAILLAYLEYYYIRIDSLPSREAMAPLVGPIYSYQAVVFLPLIVLAAFQPLIQDRLLNLKADAMRTSVPLGATCTLLGLVLLDSLWFAFRAFAPSAGDPLAWNWIRSVDYSASALGSVDILGAIIPIWYFAAAPIIFAVLAALLILPHED